MSKRAVAVLACGVGLSMSAPAGAPAQATVAGCAAPHSRTISANAFARIYEDTQTGSLNACVYQSPLLYPLVVGGRVWFPPPAIDQTGPFLGVATNDAEDSGLIVVVFRLPSTRVSIGYFPVNAAVGSLRVARDGTAVLALCRDNAALTLFHPSREMYACRHGQGPFLTEIYRLSARPPLPGNGSPKRKIGRSRHIDPYSLKLNGRHATWTQNGHRIQRTI